MTALAISEGWIPPKDAYIGHDGHLYLKGQAKSAQRHRVFEKHDEKCSVCGAYCPEQGSDFTAAHWHHRSGCDCLACSEVRCNPFTGRKCHAHRESGFKRKAEDYKKENHEQVSQETG